MKRVFSGILAALVLMILLVAPCFAQETEIASPETSGAHIEDADIPSEETADAEEPGEEIIDDTSADILTDAWNWVMDKKDDIMAIILLIAAALYKLGSAVIKKKILPEITKQSERVTEMASAAGKITQTNAANFMATVEEFKKILNEDEEREKRLSEAIAASERNREEYRQMCEKYEAQNKALVASLVAQEQMVYEALMSAKLTDVRKEEIERQHLKRLNEYESLEDTVNGGDADEAVAS